MFHRPCIRLYRKKDRKDLRIDFFPPKSSAFYQFTKIMCEHTDTKILDMCGQTDTKFMDMCGQTDTKILDIWDTGTLKMQTKKMTEERKKEK